MIINSNDLKEMIFWNQIQYLGLPFISVLWLMVALLYTKTIYSLKTQMVFLLFSVPGITFFMRLTNSWHHLFYTKWEIRQFFGYYSLYMERGFWYYVNISYTILCLLLTVIVYFIGYQKNKAGYSKPHFLVFLFASLLPFIGIVMIIFTFEEWSIDYSALIMPASLLIISYGILKYDFLEIRTLARETIFENNSAGMVVLGPGKKVIDYNKAVSYTHLDVYKRQVNKSESGVDMAKKKISKNIPLPILIIIYAVLLHAIYLSLSTLALAIWGESVMGTVDSYVNRLEDTKAEPNRSRIVSKGYWFMAKGKEYRLSLIHI